jgi:hypothetical protein
MSESWLVELTDTTLVITAGPEFELVGVLVRPCVALEQPAHAHTAATMTRTTLEARTSAQGIR